jgi:hypothetical protein
VSLCVFIAPLHLKDVIKIKKEIRFLFSSYFKSMKRMEDLVSAVSYINSDQILVAGSGIELYMMMTENKRKQNLNTLFLKKILIVRIVIWFYLYGKAVENDMSYLGLIGNTEVNEILAISKFCD